MLPSFCNDTVTRIRPQVVDKRGTKVFDWTNPDEAEITGCNVQPSTNSREMNGRTLQVIEGWTLYAPPGSDIKAGDRIAWENLTFEIDGAPMPWKSPTGRVSHVYANLREWSG